SKTSLIKALTQQLDGILQTKNNQTIITFKELKYKKKEYKQDKLPRENERSRSASIHKNKLSE
ncbi:MAG: hypothetical protein AB7D17_04255, partial [Methanobacteriales archaeon]